MVYSFILLDALIWSSITMISMFLVANTNTLTGHINSTKAKIWRGKRVCPTRKPILSGIPSTQPSLHSQGSTLSDATVGWKIHNWNNNSNFIFLSLSATDRFCVLYQCVSASKSLKASWEVYYDTVRMYLYWNIYMYINATADLHCQVFSV